MAVCNAAFEEAERRHAPEVEVGHLLLCAVRHHAIAAELRGSGLETWKLEVAAERSLRTGSTGATSCRPRTSEALRQLLEETERIAQRRGEQFAAAADLIRALRAHSFHEPELTTAVGSHGGWRHRESHSQFHTTGPTDIRQWSSRDWQPAFEATGRAARETGRDTASDRERFAAGLRFTGDVANDWQERGGDDRRNAGRELRRERSDLRTEELTRRLAAQERLLADLLARLPADGDWGSHREEPRRATAADSGARHQWLRRRARIRQVTGLRSLSRTTRGRASHGHGERDAVRDLQPYTARESRPPQRDPRDMLRDAEIDRPEADIETDEGPEATGERGKRFYLAVDDDIVRAPSIGPKTAARLAACGLFRVGHLLACDPQRVAATIGVQWITPKRIADWQAQARLVCTIPWLRGTHAQLLVGAGYETVDKLRDADASGVCAAVLKFAGTRDGQSVLRSGPAPDMERIARWLEHAHLAEPERATGPARAEAI